MHHRANWGRTPAVRSYMYKTWKRETGTKTLHLWSQSVNVDERLTECIDGVKDSSPF